MDNRFSSFVMNTEEILLFISAYGDTAVTGLQRVILLDVVYFAFVKGNAFYPKIPYLRTRLEPNQSRRLGKI